MVAFNEQVQNIEKPKTSFVEVLSCFATVKAIKESIENQMYISSQVKSALRKLRD